MSKARKSCSSTELTKILFRHRDLGGASRRAQRTKGRQDVNKEANAVIAGRALEAEPQSRRPAAIIPAALAPWGLPQPPDVGAGAGVALAPVTALLSASQGSASCAVKFRVLTVALRARGL